MLVLCLSLRILGWRHGGGTNGRFKEAIESVDIFFRSEMKVPVLIQVVMTIKAAAAGGTGC